MACYSAIQFIHIGCCCCPLSLSLLRVSLPYRHGSSSRSSSLQLLHLRTQRRQLLLLISAGSCCSYCGLLLPSCCCFCETRYRCLVLVPSLRHPNVPGR